MKTLRRTVLALLLAVGTTACGTNITGPDHTPDPGEFHHTPDPGEFRHTPDPGEHTPDPGEHTPDPGEHTPDPGEMG